MTAQGKKKILKIVGKYMETKSGLHQLDISMTSIADGVIYLCPLHIRVSFLNSNPLGKASKACINLL